MERGEGKRTTGEHMAFGVKQAGTGRGPDLPREDQMPPTGFPGASMAFGLHLICRGNGRDLGGRVEVLGWSALR